ncbi:MAG: metallophosphatase family protein [Spirochaetes bacterium]|nr:metallophosphatase family protein [Spirochaetota bacterium]
MLTAPVLPTPLSASLAGKRNYQLLLLPDIHIPHSPDILERIVNSPVLKTVDHVILLGDTVACYGTDYEYEKLGAFLERSAKPYSVVIGNHEFSFEVHDTKETYGRIWRSGSHDLRERQLAKFSSFFGIDRPYWSEQVGPYTYVFFMLPNWDEKTISKHAVIHEHDALKELPEGGDAFLRSVVSERSVQGGGVIAFCHIPLAGSISDDFVYYTPGRDPTLYLEDATMRTIASSQVPVWWFSGHLHLSPAHPVAGVRPVAANLTQIHCPSARWHTRRSLDDHNAKRYEESYSLMLRVHNGSLSLAIYDWLSEMFVSDMSRFTIAPADHRSK